MRTPPGILAVVSSLLLAAAPGAALDPSQRTMALMKIAGAVLEDHQAADRPPLLPDGRILPMSAIVSQLDPEIARWMPTKDGWGRPLRIGRDRALYVISYGADGRADVAYDRKFDEDDPDIRSQVDRRSSSRDIVWTRGAFVQKPESFDEMALQDIAAISSAMKAFLADHGRFARSTGEMETVAVLANDLAPYARDLPTLDPWDRPYWIRLDGEHSVIASTGANGNFDRRSLDVDQLSEITPVETDDDIIVLDDEYLGNGHDWFVLFGE